MSEPHVIIIGGGLAGLAAGCYARRSGYDTTIVEHNLALGGLCTAWSLGPYQIDGCIHWLTGGPFTALYDELEITSRVPLRRLDAWQTYAHRGDGTTIPVTRDLDALVAELTRLAPEDAAELARVRAGATDLIALTPTLDTPELVPWRERLRPLWDMRGALGPLLHFRRPIGEWAHHNLRSPALRRFFAALVPDTAPAFFLLLVLGYLERGYLSRPVGGSAAFRDALTHTYQALGGHVQLHATVDEVLVRDGRAAGVRLADGTMMTADAVISTASAPESVLRLLGGRYGAEPTRERLERWKLFDPIVMASFGVDRPYAGHPALRTLDGVAPRTIGGRSVERATVRVLNDDPAFAPPGHTVVQAIIPADYTWWATRGTRYHDEKAAVTAAVLELLAPDLPGLRDAVRAVDVVTPLTFWGRARAWRGAYEGWMPDAEHANVRVEKKLPGLEYFYMAGQWVEPGGGVPMALMSGRQAVQLLCADEGRLFRTSA
ncbi:MAG: NAD(P)/FAD-dependent oxidoreductase [Myxococcales bacterium]|nr:NAD(P)/FAD-dependent oxidoreductase [Myxococcales bacterium]